MNARKLVLALLPLMAVATACEGPPEEPLDGADPGAQADPEAQADPGAPPDSCPVFAKMDLTPTTDPIEITFGPDGIRVEPDTSYVSRRGGKLAWRSSDHPFVVAFHHRRGALPFGQAPRAGRPGSPVSLAVAGSPPCGTYKYSVMVWDAAGDSMAVLDPPYMLIP